MTMQSTTAKHARREVPGPVGGTAEVAPPGDETSESGAQSPSTHRVCLLVAAIALFSPAIVAWTSIVQLPYVGLISAASCGAALVLAVMAITARSPQALRRTDIAVLGFALALLVGWAFAELYFYPSYGTDESAFVQYSAQLLTHGHNPYTSNLLPALTLFRVPISFATYTLNGTIVSTLGYPALSFLIVVPAVALTHGVQAIIAENVAFLALEMVLTFFMLPRAYRSLAIVVILGLNVLFNNSVGGVILTLAVPFMIIVAYHWRNLGEQGRLGRVGILSGVCLGCAAGISQFPWFVVPFLLFGIWKFRSRELGRKTAGSVTARFAAIALGAFVLINAPFIVWSPRAWITGVVSPLTQHAIPFGQGLIDATILFHIGGGSLSSYEYASITVFMCLFLLYVRFFDRISGATFILPSLGFFFATRSLSEYFFMMVAVWLVAFLAGGTVSTAPAIHSDRPVLAVGGRLRVRTSSMVLGAGCILAGVFIGSAMLTPAPLKMTIQSVESNGQFQGIWRIKAQVTNQTGHRLDPHFATNASGYMTTFWNVVNGPSSVGPHRRAVYDLVAPNIGSMPGVTQPFYLQAVTASPDTISSSGLFVPEQFSCYISPNYVDRIVPFGQRVALQVTLRSPYGAPVHRGGVPVALGQVIYGQDSLIPAEGSINGEAIGQTPIVLATNSQGTASFTVSDSFAQGGNPLYFQAYVDPTSGFPYGYSETVSVQWDPGR